MKTSLVIMMSILSLLSLQGQDSLVMKYQYAFEYERHFRSDIIPLHKYAQVFSIKNGLEAKEAETATSLLQLHKTWRAKKNEDLNYKDFIFIERGYSSDEIGLMIFEDKKELVQLKKDNIDIIFVHEGGLGIGAGLFHSSKLTINPRSLATILIA
jgi:1-aminocyclopropane-1-carboxylate deaminase/D-cysteine desulfhydrase-like pyridoxal-dependent ACC family enzyme